MIKVGDIVWSRSNGGYWRVISISGAHPSGYHHYECQKIRNKDFSPVKRKYVEILHLNGFELVTQAEIVQIRDKMLDDLNAFLGEF